MNNRPFVYKTNALPLSYRGATQDPKAKANTDAAAFFTSPKPTGSIGTGGAGATQNVVVDSDNDMSDVEDRSDACL